ncbi:helix-turn-helix domain-containing protein [Paenibacillus gansuensis]|uniref:Helix-turn-helix domain-containing protein n=1 Tax=Paenibacillus gansuensis TaxID=306542 RepID=A0ABW5PCW4_9BACL
MANQLLKLIGIRIRELRKERGLSQEQLGEKAGFHFSYIGGIERAEKNISILNLAKIASALGVHIGEIFVYIQSGHDVNTDKEAELEEILQILLGQDIKGLRKAKTILKELYE